MFLVILLRSDCLGNLDIVEKVVDYLFVIVLHQFLLQLCIVILVMFRLLQGKVLRVLYFVVFKMQFFVSLVQVVYFY